MEIHPPGTRIGPYEIASRPMMGGMGIVYICLDRETDHPVALKTFKPEFLPDRAARDRFLREGTHWVDLGAHPHVVRCYEVLRIDPEVYLVLELIAKEQGRDDASLRSWLTPSQPLPVEQSLLFALQIARGMAHAVERIPGFVHRDLKPENILVGADRLSQTKQLSQVATNRLRVTDFGLATVLESAIGNQRLHRVSEEASQQESKVASSDYRTLLTEKGVVGTPEYMAPEQWERHNIDVRADVYALGCVLLEMLLGQMPVKARPRLACCQLHQSGQALQKARTTQGVPVEIVSVLTKCLAVEPGERYTTWVKVEAALVTAYAELAGRPAPEAALAADLSWAERVAAGWSYSTMGVSYLDIGKAEVAVGYFERALEVSERGGERRLQVAGLNHLGLAYDNLGDTHRAIGYYEQALEIVREIGDRWGEGATLGNLGNAYRQLGDARRAVKYLDQRLAIAREIKGRREQGNAINDLGAAYLQLGDIRMAIEYYEQCLTIHREIGDRRGESAALGNLGSAYAQLGYTRRAIQHYEQHLFIAREIGDRQREGIALGNLGNAYLQLGNVRRAIEYYEQRLETAGEIGDRRGEGNALGNLGIAYANLGDARRAIEYYEQGLTIHREVGNRHGEGLVLGSLGGAYRKLGNRQRAITYYEQALTIAREIEDRRGEGSALGNLGNVYRQLGNASRAIEYFEQALEIDHETGDLMGVAQDSFNMALLYVQQREPDRALFLAQKAVDIFTQIGHTQYAHRAQQLVTQLQAAIR